MEKEVLLSCKGICKEFGPTRALINVDFEIRRGQVCGLIGENGSGKSTLTSIFAGAQQPNRGEMFCKGQPYKPANMVQAQMHKVAMVVQEAGTLPTVDVATNVFVGNLERFKKHGFLDVKTMKSEADRILAEVGAPEIKADMPLAVLNFEDRKIVEIARAMYLEPDVLIIDETTTALATKGRNIIYNIIRKMQQEDKAVIFISHDLDELIQVCNTITVLRDGVMIDTLNGGQMTVDNMRRLMVGRDLQGDYFRSDWDGRLTDEVLLDVRHVTSGDGYIENLSLQLHKGEILGLGGLANCGMHELGRIMFGIDKPVTGEVIVTKTGKNVSDPVSAVRQGLGYVSKDRDKESLMLQSSIQDNIVLPNLDRLQKNFHLSQKDCDKEANEQVKSLRIKCVSAKQFCTELSGGNKQKVAFGKWMGAGCDILILDCPTRGIDIGVKADMYKLINDMKKQGMGIVMISEELVELIGMSDRMVIMKDGHIAAEVMRSPDVTDSQLIEYII